MDSSRLQSYDFFLYNLKEHRMFLSIPLRKFNCKDNTNCEQKLSTSILFNLKLWRIVRNFSHKTLDIFTLKASCRGLCAQAYCCADNPLFFVAHLLPAKTERIGCPQTRSSKQKKSAEVQRSLSCLIRTRTRTGRTKNCSATITP